ncbi:MAG: extracellular solute-binding protein [Microbacterium sp.]
MARRLLHAAAAAAALGMLVACSAGEPTPEATSGDDLVAAALAEGEVVVYSGQLDPTNEAIKAGFEAAYPGITVRMAERMSTAATAQRIDADVRTDGHIGADIIIAISDQALVTYLADEELTRPVSASEFGVDEQFQYGPNAVAQAVTAPVVGYNTEVLEAAGADPITSWDDLLQPELDGLIQIADPEGSATWAGTWSIIYNDTTLGEDFIAGLAATGYQPVASATVGTEQLVAKQAGVLLFTVPSQLQAAKDAGNPIEMWFPEDPAPATQNYNVLPSGSDHPNAGRLLMQWLYSTDGQSTNVLQGAVPVIPDVPGALPLPDDFQGPPAPYKVQQDLPVILQLLDWT